MKIAANINPRERQEELGQFLTAPPVADFMASMFGPLPSVPSNTERIRWAKLIEAIIEVFRPRWYLDYFDKAEGSARSIEDCEQSETALAQASREAQGNRTVRF